MPFVALPPPPALSAAYDPLPTSFAAAPERPRGAPPDPVSAFLPGTVEVKLRVGFAARSLSPVSLLGAFLGWTELQLATDVGVLRIGDLGLGVGGEVHYARPWLAEILSEAVVNLAGVPMNWSLVETGLAGRLTLHYLALEKLDPYALFLVGGSYTHFRAEVTVDDITGLGSWDAGGARIGGGGGVTTVSDQGFVAGVELRYIAGLRFKEQANVDLVDDTGTVVDVFEMSRLQNPPRGFSWMVFAGLRF